MNKLIFNKRMELSNIFDEYARFHRIAENSFSVITFLAKEDLLDLDKVEEFLKVNKKIEIS